MRAFFCRFRLHRRRTIGRFRELKICPHCLRVYTNPESLGIAKIAAAISHKSLIETYSENDRQLVEQVIAVAEERV